MQILFLSHYFPPEVNAPASRLMEHARVWANDGHEVHVLTCVPNHPHGIVYEGYRNRLYQTETVDGVTVYRVLTLTARNAGTLRRTAGYFFYLIAATASAPFLPRPDVVISTSPQMFCGLAGYVVSRIKRRPWVLEIRDLWPDSIVTVGAMKRGIVVRFLEALEAFAYRNADSIAIVSEAFRSHIADRCDDADKIKLISNGVDLNRFCPKTAGGKIRADADFGERFVAAYVGTHGMAHGLETILSAAKILRQRQDILFLLVGDGAEREKLLRIKADGMLDNVVMLGQRPKGDMPEIWARTSVSLIVLRKSEVFSKVIPSKLFESMAMKVPIVLGVQGESARLLQESKAGICVEPENPEALAAAVAMMADDDKLRAEMGLSGRRFVEAHYDRSSLARQYAQHIEALLAKS